MAFLTPSLAKTNGNHDLVLTLNYTKKLTTAATAQTFGVASAISSFDQANPIFQGVLFQSLGGASQAFDSLSGGGYGRLDRMLADGFGRAELRLDGEETTAPSLQWSDNGATSPGSLKSGFEAKRGPFAFGLVAGHTTDRTSTDSIEGEYDTRFLAGMVGYRSGRFRGWLASPRPGMTSRRRARSASPAMPIPRPRPITLAPTASTSKALMRSGKARTRSRRTGAIRESTFARMRSRKAAASRR